MLRRMSDLATAEAERVAASCADVGETSLALHRLTRVVQLNIALEQKLVEDLRHPGGGGQSPAQRRKAAEQAAQLAEKREIMEAHVAKYASTDPLLDREVCDELLAELRQANAIGTYDGDLLALDPKTVGWMFMDERSIKAGAMVDFWEMPEGVDPEEYRVERRRILMEEAQAESGPGSRTLPVGKKHYWLLAKHKREPPGG
jgi:hypothetical protein